jgi:UDP-N-acetylglucosamine 2-epimerase
VEAGTVKLVGASHDPIVRGVSELLDNPEAYQKMATASNPYGDGQASDRIIAFLKTKFGNFAADAKTTAALHLVFNDVNGCIQPINISFFSSYYQL